jgi:hypothetical protein
VWGTQQSAILTSLNLSAPSVRKFFKILHQLMKCDNENQEKLGGPGSIVQIDETMTNFKVKVLLDGPSK